MTESLPYVHKELFMLPGMRDQVLGLTGVLSNRVGSPVSITDAARRAISIGHWLRERMNPDLPPHERHALFADFEPVVLPKIVSLDEALMGDRILLKVKMTHDVDAALKAIAEFGHVSEESAFDWCVQCTAEIMRATSGRQTLYLVPFCFARSVDLFPDG